MALSFTWKFLVHTSAMILQRLNIRGTVSELLNLPITWIYYWKLKHLELNASVDTSSDEKWRRKRICHVVIYGIDLKQRLLPYGDRYVVIFRYKEQKPLINASVILEGSDYSPKMKYLVFQDMRFGLMHITWINSVWNWNE